MTTHWPPRKGENTTSSPGVWVPDGRESVIQRVSPGDRVWLYQSASGKAIRTTNPDGTSSVWPCKAGRQGVIALLEVTGAPFARDDQEPETYVDGSSLWWRWFAPTVTINSAGYIPRQRAAELIGYAPTYVFHGFGERKSGLKELDPATFQMIHTEFVGSYMDSDAAKLRKMAAARGGGGTGGEGAVHKKLKAAIEADSTGFLGEPGLTCIQTEYPFPTGDRIDVLLRDKDGRYLAVEIEPDCAEQEVSGPLQCMKYRSLLAYTLDRPEQEVRTMLVSRTIHDSIRTKCGQFGIELHIVGAGWTAGAS
jgi:hypothetical protein